MPVRILFNLLFVLNRIIAAQECDAREDAISIAAGFIKLFFRIINK
jgi:hypothetical protein